MLLLAFRRCALVLGLVALWELAPRVGWVPPVFIPPPSAVLATIAEVWVRGDLAAHTWLSATRALLGLLVGVAIGPALGLIGGGWFPRLRFPVAPVLELCSQANPVVLFHVVVLFLGIGEIAKIAIIAWLCTWPIAFGAMSGVREVDPELVRIGRAFGLGRMALLTQIVLPSAAPSLFTGIRLAGGYAFVMLIGAEMMGTSSGLGWFVVQSQEAYNARRIFAGASIITALGLATDLVLEALESRLVTWNPIPDARRVLLSGGAARA